MGNKLIFTAMLVLMLLPLSSCAAGVSPEEYNKVCDDLTVAQAQLSQARGDLENLRSKLSAAQSERDRLSMELEALKEQVSREKQRSYNYWYSVQGICGYQPNRSHYLEFALAKDEQLYGKLIVEPGWVGWVAFSITDDYGHLIEDAKVREGEDYSFSIKAEQSGVRYTCWFNYGLLAYASSAIFYCNFPADNASSPSVLTHQIPPPAHTN